LDPSRVIFETKVTTDCIFWPLTRGIHQHVPQPTTQLVKQIKASVFLSSFPVVIYALKLHMQTGSVLSVLLAISSLKNNVRGTTSKSQL